MQNEAKVEEARRSPKVLKVSFFFRFTNQLKLKCVDHIPINKIVERTRHPKRRINNKSNTFLGKLQQNGWMVFFKEMQVMKGKLPLPAKMQAGRMLQTLIAFSYKGKKCFRQQIYCGIQDCATVSIAALSRASLAQSSVF